MLFFSHSLCACKVHCLLNVAIGFNLLWLIAKIRLNSLQLPSFPQLAGILSTFKSKKKDWEFNAWIYRKHYNILHLFIKGQSFYRWTFCLFRSVSLTLAWYNADAGQIIIYIYTHIPNLIIETYDLSSCLVPLYRVKSVR